MSDLIITGVIDGPLSGGLPKAIEFFALNDIPDLSIYGFGSANNGGGTDGQEYTFSGSATAGDYVYIASTSSEPGFTSFFGFAQTDNSSAANINGDDAIELFQNGSVVDVFGDINVDGTGQPWEHLDGWAYRVSETTTDGTFTLTDWTFSSPNALDGETSNGNAATPFPIGTFADGGTIPSNITINEVDADTPGTDTAEFIELYDGGAGNTALDGLAVVLFNGSDDQSYEAFDLDGFTTDANGFFVLGNSGVTNVGLTFNGNTLQNGADAVALYQADATDFPNDTAITTTDLLDVIVYDTDDNDDTGLLAGFGESTQFNEDANGDKDNESNSRVPDGTGTFVAQAPTPGVTNVVTTPPPSDAFVHEIQGSGTASPILGNTVTIEAVVTGDFQNGDADTLSNLEGFYVQEEDSDADADSSTSEGLFIFEDGNFLTDVNVGDVVQVTGTVEEAFGETQLTVTSAADITVVSSGNPLPTAATVNFPVATVADLETVEGMQVTIPDTLFVTEYFNLDRFGEIVLSSDGASNAPGTDGRLDQYTQFNAPDVAGFTTYQQEIEKRRIVLDDGQFIQNPDPIIHGRGGNPLSATNTLRGGDTVNNLSGILGYDFGDYRIQPTAPVDFQAVNTRPNTPDNVGGDLKVVSFNVLNFFTTLDVSGNPGSGPNNLDPRGADNQTEYDRQLEKLVTTLEDIDADIVGLVELENEFGSDQNGDNLVAINELVNALNSQVGAGTYAAVDPGSGFVDTGDAISVGAIYKADTVQVAQGTTVEILDDATLSTLGLGFTNPVFDGVSTNRASLAATFEETATGETVTVAVNHFKSKGSVNPAPGNADAGDGAGNNNAIRLQASQALDAWLDSDPTGSGDPDFLILGDLNAYAKEDPITFLEGEGYTNVVDNPDSAYSFVFDGQFGTLDYGLASNTLISQVTGATEWHVNADEPDALDYNLDFGRDPSLFSGADPFRNSDHDPLIIGLDLASTAPQSIGEIGSISSLDHTRQTINLQQTYFDPVVIVQPASFDGADPVAIRIDNLDTDSFEVFLQEPSNLDGIHWLPEDLSYMVVEAGSWELADGTKIEADNFNQGGLVTQGQWQSVNFDQSFSSTPAVFSQIQTFNGPNFSRTRQNLTTTTGVNIGIEEQDSLRKSGHLVETLGYIAMETGSGVWDSMDYEVGLTEAVVDHTFDTITFSNIDSTPQLIASIASYNGPDAVGLRYQNLGSSSVEVKLREDTSLDAEVWHLNEQVSYFAIEGTGLLSGTAI